MGIRVTLDGPIPLAAYAELPRNARRGVYVALSAALSAGLRKRPLPQRWTNVLRVARSGIDEFANQLLATGPLDGAEKTMAALWQRARRDSGLPTGVNVDLNGRATRDLYEKLCAQAGAGQLERGPRAGQLTAFRCGVRAFYLAACATKQRQLQVPEYILKKDGFARRSVAALIARLPQGDRRSLKKLDEDLERLVAARQAGRRPEQRRLPDGRWLKPTVSHSGRVNLLVRLNSFLHHADRMDWDFSRGLHALLTPKRVSDWVYLGTRPGGDPMGPLEPRHRRHAIVELIERMHFAKMPLLDSAHGGSPKDRLKRHWRRVQAIRAQLETDRGCISNTAARQRKENRISQIVRGLARIDEWVAESGRLHEIKLMSDLDYWRCLRDSAMFLVAFFGMMRLNSAATMSGLHLVPDADAEREGAAKYLVHVKETLHASAVEPQLVIGRAMDAVRRLQAFEQSLSADGARDWKITKGQSWGLDPWLQAHGFDVQPVWRKSPTSPQPLTYAGVRNALIRAAMLAGWERTDVRALRIAGAIWWGFVAKKPTAVAETIGHWSSDSVTLKTIYLRVARADAEAMALSTPGASSRTNPRVTSIRRPARAKRLSAPSKARPRPRASSATAARVTPIRSRSRAQRLSAVKARPRPDRPAA